MFGPTRNASRYLLNKLLLINVQIFQSLHFQLITISVSVSNKQIKPIIIPSQFLTKKMALLVCFRRLTGAHLPGFNSCDTI